MEVYSQLVRAQLENKNGDYASGRGMFWFNTSTSLFKFYDGSAVRSIVTTDNTQTLTNKSLNDTTTTFQNTSDTTKKFQFLASGITAGQTRVYTVPDLSATMVASDSPADTKGDIYAYSTKLVKVGIGTDGQVLTADSASTPGLKWATPATAPDQSYEISNVSFATSVGTSALTVALKDKSGSDPSAGSPCRIGFRTATATTGTYSQRTATGALSIVVPSTATLGFAGSSVTNYLYVYAIDNAGTIELAVSGSIFDEGTLLNTTSLSTGSDSISVIYSTTGRTGVAIRLIGRVKFTLATAGTWDEAGDELSLVPFVKIPVIARYSSSATTTVNSASVTLVDYATKVIDSHNSVTTGASWVFTAPKATTYFIAARARFGTAGWNAAEAAEMYIYKNGSEHATIDYHVAESTTTRSVLLNGSGLVSLAVGETVDIRIRQDSSSGMALDGAASYTTIDIFEVTGT